MRSMPVVLMQPGVEFDLTFGGVLVEPGISPFVEGGLGEVLGLAVGAGSVGAGAEMANAELTTGSGEGKGVVAGSVVGEEAPDANPESGVVSDGSVEESDRGIGAFVGIELPESDAGMVVNGHVQQLPAGAADSSRGLPVRRCPGLTM